MKEHKGEPNMASIYRVYGKNFSGERNVVVKDNGAATVFLVAEPYEASAIRQTVEFFEPVRFDRYLSVTEFKKLYGALYNQVKESF